MTVGSCVMLRLIQSFKVKQILIFFMFGKSNLLLRKSVSVKQQHMTYYTIYLAKPTPAFKSSM